MDLEKIVQHLKMLEENFEAADAVIPMPHEAHQFAEIAMSAAYLYKLAKHGKK